MTFTSPLHDFPEYAVEVTSEELAKIIQLREKNTSWSEIERQTGVPRQIAKRAYLERQLKISREELKAARQTVAAEDLRWHIDCLIKVAKSLVTILDIPSFSDVRSADDILLNLWETDILGEYEARPPYQQPTHREFRGRIRQNQRLFKSLKDHTDEKIDWKYLDNWKDAWDACKEPRDKLKGEAQEILSNKLKENPELREGVLKGSKGKHIIEQMADGIIHSVWEGIVNGKVSELIDELDKKDKTGQDDKVDQILDRLGQEIASAIQAVSNGDGMTEILFEKTTPMSVPIFGQADRAKEIVKICISVCDTLCRGEKVKSLVAKLRIMRKAINYLEENLDPIILRPMILNSPKCELCPA